MSSPADRERPLGVDDLIEAMCNHLRWNNAHADLQAYWSERYRVLYVALGFNSDPLADPVDGELSADDFGLRILMRGAANGALRSPSPFAGFLEASGAVVDIFQEYGDACAEHDLRHHELHCSIVHACLRVLAPDIDQRTCAADVLTRARLPEIPDLDDYW